MADSRDDLSPDVLVGDALHPGPAIVEYQKPPRVHIVQVIKQDLESLGKMSDDEGLTSIYLGLAGGAFISCALALLTSSDTTSARAGALITLSIGSALAALYMGVKFYRQRKARLGLLARLLAGGSTR